MTSNNFKIPKNINCLAKADFNKLLNIKDYFLKSIASAFDSVIENFLKNEAVFYYNFGNPKYIEKMLKAVEDELTNLMYSSCYSHISVVYNSYVEE